MYSPAKTCARSPIFTKVILPCPSLDLCSLYMTECSVLDEQPCYLRNQICRSITCWFFRRSFGGKVLRAMGVKFNLTLHDHLTLHMCLCVGFSFLMRVKAIMRLKMSARDCHLPYLCGPSVSTSAECVLESQIYHSRYRFFSIRLSSAEKNIL